MSCIFEVPKNAQRHQTAHRATQTHDEEYRTAVFMEPVCVGGLEKRNRVSAWVLRAWKNTVEL